MDKETISHWFRGLQDRICADLEVADGSGRFREDQWTRPGGGGGRTRVINGDKIAKGGVNFSAVEGTLSEAAGRALGTGAGDFYATGVSIVLHPKNPWVPIIHMNVRYFSMGDTHCWFGGGIDLTPHYVVAEDALWFYTALQEVCDRHHPAYYPEFSQWADRYFYLPHRGETRGIGGIFFDRLQATDEISKTDRWKFVQAVGEAFVPLYTHYLNRDHARPYGERQLRWQGLRRGRYVEFNLVWDRGTRFGLETEGRTESILMSLPPVANWVYDFQPEPGSLEADTLAWLQKPPADQR